MLYVKPNNNSCHFICAVLSCIANALLLDSMPLLSVITVLLMPLRKNICYFPLMSYIASFHFLGIILHHSDVEVSTPLCSTLPWDPVQQSPRPSSLIFSFLSFTSLLCCCPQCEQWVHFFDSAGRERAEMCREQLGQPALAGNKCAMEDQRQNDAILLTKQLVYPVRVVIQNHPVRTEDWKSKILPTCHIILTVFVDSVVCCCM